MEVVYEKLKDEELIELSRAKDEKAEELLITRYKNLVRLKARALFLEGGDHEDLLQEGMVGLLKAAREYDSEKEASFQTFASTCITNQMLTAISKASRKKHAALNEALSLSWIAEENVPIELPNVKGPESLIIEKEEEAVLRKKIKDLLSPMENDVLKFYMSGIGYKQIAAIMGKSEKSIDNAIQRIRNKIKNIT